MPRRLPLLLAALLLAPVGARADELPAAEPPPRTLKALGEVLDRLTARLDELLELAARHPRYRELETYVAYTAEDFEERRDVKARDIVDLMADSSSDPQVPLALRRGAKDALLAPKALTHDPDLQAERGPREPRKRFATRYVIKLLMDDDAITRQLAHELLIGWFGDQRDTAIRFYKAREGTKQEWRDAYDAWRDILRR